MFLPKVKEEKGNKNMTFMESASLTIQALSKQLETSLEQGLTNQEAITRQNSFGLNELKGHQIGWLHILWRQLKSPFVALLIAAAIISYCIEGNSNAIIIGVIVFFQTVLGFYQEYRAYKALEYLQNFITASVRVIREGRECMVHTKELVPGDIIVLIAGDIIPADVRFFKEYNLMVDEAVLTGESIPVKKSVDVCTPAPTQPHQACNIGFSGTTIVSGKAWAVVYATGKATMIGDIARLASTGGRPGIFEKSLAQFSRFILYVTLITVTAVFVAQLLLKGAHAHITELVMFALALAVGITPDALPLVTTFAHARGARVLAKLKVIVKRLSAIDDLGSIQVLCVDKTGTLTENKLSISAIHSEQKEQTIVLGALASADWSIDGKKIENTIDQAFWNALRPEDSAALRSAEKIIEIPFDPQRRCNVVVVRRGTTYELIARGMVEAVAAFCDDVDKEKYLAWSYEQGNQGKRVIGVAYKTVDAHILTFEQAQHETKNLKMVGLVAFVDPVKKTVPEYLLRAHKLGIMIKIISGDAPEVVGSVAHQLNILPLGERVMTGDMFEALSAEEQKSAAYTYSVFARIKPQSKYAIIKSLQEKYQVGFLGDGINDAPALQLADVGLVVDGASEVARQAADIILLKKSLHVIVDGIEQGRIIFINTIKYVRIVLASNVSSLYSIALASLMLDFLPMLPLQILLVNLLADIALIAIATDNVDEQEAQLPIAFSMRSIALVSLTLGLVGTLFDFIFFAFLFHSPAPVMQTCWFLESMLTEMIFVFSMRTRLPFFRAVRPSWSLILCVVAVSLFAIALPLTATGKHFFGFVALSYHHYALIASIVMLYFITTECVKLLYYRIVTRK